MLSVSFVIKKIKTLTKMKIKIKNKLKPNYKKILLKRPPYHLLNFVK